MAKPLDKLDTFVLGVLWGICLLCSIWTRVPITLKMQRKAAIAWVKLLSPFQCFRDGGIQQVKLFASEYQKKKYFIC